ncbi:FeoA family protein [Desulfobacter vibrioformis]|uniref:FeoA family protein n=1 Tax=Desulfobacter vibrioformis TaxID=34031 RepID=UPI000550475E|nr:ferrous iron transport protein A [Desulfobacter vibrioformis]
MIPLTWLRAWEVGVVQDISGKPGFVSRISATGFSLNTEVKMIRNWKWGPLIIFLRDTQIALGRTEAGNIMVRKKSESK